jgi:hypothetical protein
VGPSRTAAEQRRDARLAELVAGLTGCERTGALHAVREHADDPDALEVVARAMVEIDRPPPDGFRLAGFLRTDLGSGIELVHHHSLRRWERLPAPDARRTSAGEVADGDAIDLTDDGRFDRLDRFDR